MTPRVDPIFFNREPEHLRGFSELVSRPSYSSRRLRTLCWQCSVQMRRLLLARTAPQASQQRKMSPIDLKVISMSESKRIRILSVEDHPVFREGLATIISSQSDMELTAQASNAIEAIAEFRKHRPDITLMDLRLPGSSGTDALVAIRGECPEARIVILTSSGSDAELQKAMRSGAVAYVLKTTPKNELLAIIRSVHRGNKYVSGEVAARLAENMGQESLTERELQVLQLIRDGNRNKQIADRLSISETTVNFHIKNLVGKLGANDRAHAVTIAIRRGLLEV